MTPKQATRGRRPSTCSRSPNQQASDTPYSGGHSPPEFATPLRKLPACLAGREASHAGQSGCPLRCTSGSQGVAAAIVVKGERSAQPLRGGSRSEPAVCSACRECPVRRRAAVLLGRAFLAVGLTIVRSPGRKRSIFRLEPDRQPTPSSPLCRLRPDDRSNQQADRGTGCSSPAEENAHRHGVDLPVARPEPPREHTEKTRNQDRPPAADHHAK